MKQISELYQKMVDNFGEWQTLALLIALALLFAAGILSYEQIIEFVQNLLPADTGAVVDYLAYGGWDSK